MRLRTIRLFVFVFLIIPLLLLGSSCRTRTRRVAPRVEPAPVSQETQLTSSQPDFVAGDSEPAIDRTDLLDLNRRAREQGWIRDAFFSFNSPQLDGAARAALLSTAQWLLDNPDMNLLIEGHCDERGTQAYNLALGDRRAESARQYLVFLGIDPNRLRTISYGEERPFSLSSNEEAWAQNRRAHLVLQGIGRG